MYDVIEAFEFNQNLIVEAPVGIGKSLGYLIPGILLSIKTKKPLVVASSTIQLTEQLNHDVKIAAKILNTKVQTVVGKGIKNYPCKKKISEDPILLDEEKSYYLNEIQKKITKQNPGQINLQDWYIVEAEKCSFRSCSYYKECEYYRVRKDLINKKQYGLFDEYIPSVLIVNQDLLLADLQSKANNSNNIINESPCMIVIDEVHNLEEKQRSMMTKKFNLSHVISYIKELLNILSNNLEKYKINIYKRAIINLTEDIEKYKINLKELYIENNLTSENIREEIPENIFNNNHYDMLRNLIDTYELYTFMDKNKRINRFSENKLAQLKIFNEYLSIRKRDSENFIEWSQYRKNSLFIYFCPDNHAKFLQDNLFHNNKDYPVVCVSATIRVPNTANDGYEYIMRNIGLEKYGVFEKHKENEFDYSRSSLFIPENLPDHNLKNNNYYFEISKRILQLTKENDGGTLVLFTSKEDINKVYEILKLDSELNKKIYLDNGMTSQKEIINDFKITKGIILGTGIFWEGIDLKGEYLTSLIIVQLPFPVPDPIIHNKARKLGDFDKVLLPEMLMKLKQGIGRLIRTKEDVGLLTILDDRLNNNNYRFLDVISSVIPISNRINENEVIEVLHTINLKYGNKK